MPEHIPVLLNAVLNGLNVAAYPDGLFIDGTVGAGGHANAILKAAPRSRLLGFDRDPRSLAVARETLAPFEDRVILVHDVSTASGVRNAVSKMSSRLRPSIPK